MYVICTTSAYIHIHIHIQTYVHTITHIYTQRYVCSTHTYIPIFTCPPNKHTHVYTFALSVSRARSLSHRHIPYIRMYSRLCRNECLQHLLRRSPKVALLHMYVLIIYKYIQMHTRTCVFIFLSLKKQVYSISSETPFESLPFPYVCAYHIQIHTHAYTHVHFCILVSEEISTFHVF